MSQVGSRDIKAQYDHKPRLVLHGRQGGGCLREVGRERIGIRVHLGTAARRAISGAAFRLLMRPTWPEVWTVRHASRRSGRATQQRMRWKRRTVADGTNGDSRLFNLGSEYGMVTALIRNPC